MSDSSELIYIKRELKQYYGGGTFYHGMFKSSIYTEGAKALFDLAKAWWLYDIIQTEVLDLLRTVDPEVYYFSVASHDNEGVCQVKNYEGTVVWEKHIEFTDFPEGEIEVCVGWDGNRLTTCLYSEN